MKNKFKKVLKKISGHKIIFIVILLLFCGLYLGTKYSSYAEFVSKFSEAGGSNGITGTTTTDVILDDLKNDWYYYMGLNYTSSTSDALPTLSDKEIYTKNNLVQTKITYSGTDLNNNLVGYVSKSERQHNYVYYKIYPVNTNGTTNKNDDYIEIELIDSPFTDRPTSKAFNGWTTSYQGVTIGLDMDIYVRKAKVPVTYSDNEPDKIEITFNANWFDSTWTTVSSSRNWQTAFGSLESAGFHSIDLGEEVIEYEPYDMSGYFYRVTIARYASYAGYYNSSGVLQNSGTCNSWGGCTYYQLIENEYFDSTQTYYYLNNRNTMTQLNNSTIELTVANRYFNYNSDFNADYNMAGFFTQVHVDRYESNEGLYDDSGNILNGSCNTRNGCDYYKLLNYYDENNNEQTIDTDTTYYYLTTRDTNIIVMTSNLNNTWGTNQNKPFTLTSVLYNNDYRNNVTWGVSGTAVNAYADTVIENIRINYGSSYSSTYTPPTNTTTSGIFVARYFNVKIGRGITRTNSNGNFRCFISGSHSTTGSSTSLTRYKIIVESGYYNSMSLTDGNPNTSYNAYVYGYGVYGNDYDRATNTNTNMDVYFCASGGWKNNIRSTNSNNVALDLTVKSGYYGSSKSDYATGIYVGGRNGGTHYAIRQITVEGGQIYNLIGGPLSDTGRANKNDIVIYIKGGTIDMVTSGAGQTTTYGNRIVQMTGGKINYSIFGGSNGYDAGNGDGKLTGSSYIYVGGTAVIGDETLISNGTTLWGAEAGSIFGIGNGNANYETIGSNNGSNIIINDDAKVNNIYGGGNYSAVGLASNISTTTTNILIKGGTVTNNVYGGGNRNGSGSNSCVATINIEMTGGEVKGDIYGGSNEKGNIYGSVNVNIKDGKVKNVYGGGKGGRLNNNNPGTYVARDVNVTIGTINNGDEKPTISGSVYGGSAYGSVNGTSQTTNLSSYDTNVVINSGTISNVFGGGKGDDTYTPYVEGNVTVRVNGGTITNVYGGNDAAGSPNGTVEVYLNDGTITNTYGGGNQTGVKNTTVYLDGATSTKIFGGSNQAGNVTNSHVIATSGTATDIYGGNNEGGVTASANILIDGSTITGSVYGGGELATTTSSVVTIESGIINNIFGGGNSASLTNPSSITINDGTVTNVYGGSNQTGNVPSSNIIANGGTISNIYGANNEGGSTNVTNIKLYGSTVTGSVYGGGNQASSEHSHIELNGSTVNNIFGGGNQAGLIDSDVKLINGTVTNVYGGSNQLGNINKSNIYTVTDSNGAQSLIVTNIYGGNNKGGKTSETNINLELGEITNIFGGGNEAPVDDTNVNCSDITVNGVLYGGGNEAAVNNNTNLKLVNVSIGDSIFGGGNAGEVLGNTNVYVTSCDIDKSVYAGGNGSTAIVYGKTLLYIDGTTEIDEHVFGGGNAAATGDETLNNSSSEVNIAGATIGGNVYGGANTSVINGVTNVNIGYDTIENNSSLIKGDIVINGTIFGGGEANASGSTDYDFSFISVTTGINILIDGHGHNNFDIKGSIFGSGNASSSGGYSYIDIYNYGTSDDVKLNISLQRADRVTINNSYMELIGATDRTNEYANELFAISRVDQLKLKNNTTLYLRNGGNLLKHFVSAVDIDGEETLAEVNIDSTNKTVIKNVDNRLYLIAGKVLNVATNEKINAYGEIDGMTFLGMYQTGRDGRPIAALYDSSYDYNSTIPSTDAYYFDEGSYVLGLHETPIHNIMIDGFYSNFVEASSSDRITVKYIDPTPEDSNFYMWTIGEQVSSYEMTLTASKYLTLGTEELALSRHANPNTTFTIVGFNYNDLNSDVNLVSESAVPRIAASGTDADNTMSLVMKSSISGWMTNGETTFLSNDSSPIVGTLDYKAENANYVPTLQFYLYHSKNLSSSGNMGTVTISMLVITPQTDLSSKVERVNIIVTLKRALYNTNDYEAAITPGKQYGLFASNAVNITSNSSFSAYYSLFVQSDETIYRTGYHRALVSSYAFPTNTKITMIDYSNHSNPEYYYYVINSADYNASLTQISTNSEVAYTLDKFIKMGSTSVQNNYNESAANNRYYNSSNGYTQEEFIFIVDFGEANIASDVTDETILFELRDSNDETRISVLGIQQEQMKYNLYTNKNAVIDIAGELEKNSIHPGDTVDLIVTTNFTQNMINGNLVHDTGYFDKQLGIKITIFDSENNQVTGVSLLGATYGLDNVRYYPRVDGTTRINISEKVTNVSSRIKFNTTESLAAGTYTMKIESFGSWDGIYYGIESSDYAEISFTVLDTVYGLKVTTNEKNVIVNKDTGKTLNDNNVVVLNYKYSSNLTNPNMHISLMRRNYDSIYSTDYSYVDFADYFINEYDLSSVPHEYILSTNAINDTNVYLYLKDNLISGTYRIVVSLYDGNSFIGDDYQYIIIK